PQQTVRRVARWAGRGHKTTRRSPVSQSFVAPKKALLIAGRPRARNKETKKTPPATTNPSGGTKETAPMPRTSRETAARDSLYRAIMEMMTRRRSSRDREQSVSENYLEAPKPKAMAVCLDWSVLTPTRLDASALGGAHTVRGDTGCLGLSPHQCAQYALERCRERGFCSVKGQECVLVDVNGHNALKLNE